MNTRQTAEEVFPGNGEFQVLLRQQDWSKTPLGPISEWPRNLIAYVKMILELPSPAVICWGPEQTQIYNEGYAQIMGPRHPKYFGSPYRECWPETYPQIQPWMTKVVQQNESTRVEKAFFALTRHGFLEEAYLTFTFSALRDDSWAIGGVLQMGTEVTEAVLSERRAETLRLLALKPSAARPLQDAIELLGSNAKDIPFALLYLWNDAEGKLVLAERTANLAGDADFTKLAQAAAPALTTGNMIKLGGVPELLGEAHLGPWPESATAAWVLPLRSSALDPIRGVFVFGLSPRLHFDERYGDFLEAVAEQTISTLEKRRVEAARLESEDRFRNMAENAPVMLWVTDPAGCCIYLNKQWYDFTGQTEETGLGFGWLSAVHPDDAKPSEDVFLNANQRRESFRLDYRLRRHDGEYRWAIDAAAPRFGPNGDFMGYIGSVTDISERKAAEEKIRSINLDLERRVKERTAQLQESNQELESFSYTVSHDLRAPLRHIQGFSQMLEKNSRDKLDEKGRGYVKVISDAAQLGGQLVDDLLVFSRLGRAALSTQPVNLAQLVEEVRQELQPEAEGREVRWDIKPLPNVQADPALLRLVLKNLFSNALKYTRPRPIAVIEVDARFHPHEIEVFVKDNGVGFNMKYVDKLFGVFQRLHSAQEFEGTGIGLAHVRRIIGRHGGRTWGEGKVDEGATLHFTLPGQAPS